MWNNTPLCRLLVEGEPAWESDHDVPVLWPWFFSFAAITESRRLHTTLFDGSGRFQERLALAGRIAYLEALPGIFEEIRPDHFPRAMDAPPDAVVSFDLSALETRRPYSHGEKSRAWDGFFIHCAERDTRAALDALGLATLTSLRLTGNQQRDAIDLAARASEHGLETTPAGRGTALIHLLMGRPASRPARALTHEWIQRAGTFPPARFTSRPSPLRRLLQRWRQRTDS